MYTLHVALYTKFIMDSLRLWKRHLVMYKEQTTHGGNHEWAYCREEKQDTMVMNIQLVSNCLGGYDPVLSQLISFELDAGDTSQLQHDPGPRGNKVLSHPLLVCILELFGSGDPVVAQSWRIFMAYLTCY